MNTIKTSLESVFVNKITDEMIERHCQRSFESMSLDTVRQIRSAQKSIGHLIRRGQSLLGTEVSQEAAAAFKEDFDSALGFLRRDVGAIASMENASTPADLVTATMESMASIKAVFAKLFGKKAPVADDKKSSIANDNWKKRQEFLRAVLNPTWLKEAELAQHPITVSGRAAAMFVRNKTELTDASSIIKEVKKDLNEYIAFNRKIVSSTKPYIQWANNTWKECLKIYKSVGGDKEESDPVLTEKISAFLIENVKKRPALTLPTLNTADRLGFPRDDWSIKNGLQAASTPEAIGNIQVAPLTVADIQAINDLFYDLFEADEQAVDFFSNTDIEGFDDYPWRAHGMQEALDKAARSNPDSVKFDLHYLDNELTDFLDTLESRFAYLEDALTVLLEAAVISRP